MLHASRAEDARKHVPEDLKLVSLFGWTLGGIYLARYSGSPVGAFDELVVLAGLVWNAPTSCAWAQRVYVSNRAARQHGLHHVGLPSRLASFAQTDTAHAESAAAHATSGAGAGRDSWWSWPYAPHREYTCAHPVVVASSERGRRACPHPVAQLLLPRRQQGWAPRTSMQLPNFSGGTPEHPELIHYTCRMNARVRPMPWQCMRSVGEHDERHAEDINSVLKGKPLFCMEFGDFEMLVPGPKPLPIRHMPRAHIKCAV